MARVGLRDLWAWELTDEKNGKTTYGEPFRVARAIEATLTPNTQDASLHADDTTVEFISSVTDYDISLNVDDLTPDVKGKLLGYQQDAKGVVLESNELNAPYVAVAFRSRRSDGGYEYRVMYKVKFAPTEERYETQGDTVNFQTPSINGKAMALEDLGLFGAYVIDKDVEDPTVIDQWFKEPHMPVEKSGTVTQKTSQSGSSTK